MPFIPHLRLEHLQVSYQERLYNRAVKPETLRTLTIVIKTLRLGSDKC